MTSSPPKSLKLLLIFFWLLCKRCDASLCSVLAALSWLVKSCALRSNCAMSFSIATRLAVEVSRSVNSCFNTNLWSLRVCFNSVETVKADWTMAMSSWALLSSADVPSTSIAAPCQAAKSWSSLISSLLSGSIAKASDCSRLSKGLVLVVICATWWEVSATKALICSRNALKSCCKRTRLLLWVACSISAFDWSALTKSIRWSNCLISWSTWASFEGGCWASIADVEGGVTSRRGWCCA